MLFEILKWFLIGITTAYGCKSLAWVGWGSWFSVRPDMDTLVARRAMINHG